MDKRRRKNTAWGNELMLFYLGSVIGWLWEAAVYWFGNTPRPSVFQVLLEYRGVLHGPWPPIYGVGCVLICVILRGTGKRPLALFAVSSGLCAIIEYAASWILEFLYQARWWDYSGQFLNLNGRISLLSVLFFGLMGTAAAFLLKPAFDRWLLRLSPAWKRTVCVLLTALFLLDCGYSLAAPNLGIGVNLIGR